MTWPKALVHTASQWPGRSVRPEWPEPYSRVDLVQPASNRSRKYDVRGLQLCDLLYRVPVLRGRHSPEYAKTKNLIPRMDFWPSDRHSLRPDRQDWELVAWLS